MLVELSTDLNDMEKFIGRYKQSDLDKTMEKINPLVNESEAKLSPQEKEESRKTFTTIANSFTHFNLEDVRKEAEQIRKRMSI